MVQIIVFVHTGFPGGSAGKEAACNVGDLGSITGLGRSPGGGHGNPLPYSYLENPHGQRSLRKRGGGYTPWGHKESDTAEMTKHNCAHGLSLPPMTSSSQSGDLLSFFFVPLNLESTSGSSLNLECK